MEFIKIFVPTYIIGLLVDFLWIGVVASGFYKSQLAGLLRSTKDFAPGHWVAVALVYVAIVAGIMLFVLPRAATIGQAAGYGALFGLVTYVLYECTNYALLLHWPAKVVFVDVLWGAALGALTATIAYWFQKIGLR